MLTPLLQGLQDATWAKWAFGAAGAVTSLKFLKGCSKAEKLLMVAGGMVLSRVATDPVATYLHMQESDGLVGFLLGLFGMAVLAKVYEVILAIDPKELVSIAIVGIKKFLKIQ